MSKKALILNCQFALSPSQLGYCGPSDAPAVLGRCITTGDCRGVESVLNKYKTLTPYLRTLGKIGWGGMFSLGSAKAYWLGGWKLLLAKEQHFGILVNNMSQQGTPQEALTRFAKLRPEQFVPFHLWQVLLSARVDGANLNAVNNCMVRWGKVVRVDRKGKTATAELNCLDAKLNLVIKPVTLSFLPELVGNIKKGEVVASHWGWVNRKLSKKDELELKIWTTKVTKLYKK